MILFIFNMLGAVFEGLSFGNYENYDTYYWDLLLLDISKAIILSILVGYTIISIGKFIINRNIIVFIPLLIFLILFLGICIFEALNKSNSSEDSQNFEYNQYNEENFTNSLESLREIDYIQKNPEQALQGYWVGVDIETNEPVGLTIKIEDNVITSILPGEKSAPGGHSLAFDTDFSQNPHVLTLNEFDKSGSSRLYFKFLSEDSIGMIGDIFSENLQHQANQSIVDTAFGLKRITEERFEHIQEVALESYKKWLADELESDLYEGNNENAEIAFKHGVDLGSLIIDNGYTAFAYAAKNAGNDKILEILIGNDVDATIKGENGEPSAAEVLATSELYPEYNKFFKGYSKYTNENNNVPTNIRNNKVSTIEAESMRQVIFAYENALVEAINIGDFSIVSPYLKKNSALYNEQQELVNSLYKKGTTEQFYDLEINDIIRKENVFKVEVTVTTGITYVGESEKIKSFDWTYTVEQNESEWLLSYLE
ncbi:TcaA NTF2-like domain-containing protein [Bacillus sp. JJ722]|uniref:TcaA NTF2-like domain-containing protein n=1 Tax=Bacillus sp. JJ722 TaxID=3122973 RepID=UPI002FFE2BB8